MYSVSTRIHTTHHSYQSVDGIDLVPASTSFLHLFNVFSSSRIQVIHHGFTFWFDTLLVDDRSNGISNHTDNGTKRLATKRVREKKKSIFSSKNVEPVLNSRATDI